MSLPPLPGSNRPQAVGPWDGATSAMDFVGAAFIGQTADSAKVALFERLVDACDSCFLETMDDILSAQRHQLEELCTAAVGPNAPGATGLLNKLLRVLGTPGIPHVPAQRASVPPSAEAAAAGIESGELGFVRRRHHANTLNFPETVRSMVNFHPAMLRFDSNLNKYIDNKIFEFSGHFDRRRMRPIDLMDIVHAVAHWLVKRTTPQERCP